MRCGVPLPLPSLAGAWIWQSAIGVAAFALAAGFKRLRSLELIADQLRQTVAGRVSGIPFQKYRRRSIFEKKICIMKDLSTRIKDSDFTMAVVGIGRVGPALALSFVDRNSDHVNLVNSGILHFLEQGADDSRTLATIVRRVCDSLYTGMRTESVVTGRSASVG